MRGPAQTEAAKLDRVAAVSRVLGRPVQNVQRLASGRYTAHVPHLGEDVNERIRALGVKVEDVPTETGGRRDDVRRIEFESDAAVWRFVPVVRTLKLVSLAVALLAAALALTVRLLVKS